MSFLENLTGFLPIGKKEEKLEYFFAANIGVEKITAALWTIEGKNLKILDIASQAYSSQGETVLIIDKLLDQVLGLKEIEPQKILFGVPDLWIADDNLKDEYLKTLRALIKELELIPMAYVANSHALVHFLEKQEGIPTTAILAGIDKSHLTVIVVRAGKIDGVKVIKRGESAGSDIEKALLTFTDVETLPSKILIYGEAASELKPQLLSFSWMSKLSFLHFPKIEVLREELEIKSVCLAGGSEINSNVVYVDQPVKKQTERVSILSENSEKSAESMEQTTDETDFGFMVGDVAEQKESDKPDKISGPEDYQSGAEESGLTAPQESFGIESAEDGLTAPAAAETKEDHKRLPNIALLGIILVTVFITGAYVFLPKADVKIFVEPRILEKDTEIMADPGRKEIDEEAKIIPGQIIDAEVSGTAKETASGKKQIGDPAKGTVIVYNKTAGSISLSKGTQISGSRGTKFVLNTSVNIASPSATDSGITFGKANTTVTAVSIGADGNLPSGSDFVVAGYSTDKLAAKSEGNFAGGTSKDVTVVSSEDTQRLLAKLSSDLKQQAQQKLQEKYPDKKVLKEALSENIIRKSYSKNINDQASEFSLNMTVKYTGTAFNDTDLKTVVSKLVTTQVPDDFQLNIAETETQADVAKLEKGGKLIFLAKFRAKLMPKVDTDKIKDQIKFKTPAEVGNLLKGMDNILGAETKLTPALPAFLQRLPIFSKNIRIEVGLK